MKRLTHIGRGVQVMLVSSILLLVDSFLDWQHVAFSLGPLGSGDVGANAWDDFLGAMMGILTIVLLAWIVVRLAGFKFPLPVSETTVDVLLGGLVFAFALIKNLTNDYSTWASYVGVGLALLIFGGAWMELRAARGRQPSSANSASEPGGMETGDAASDLTDEPSSGAGA